MALLALVPDRLRKDGVPPVLWRMVRHFHVIHEQVVLVTVVTAHVPHVPDEQRRKVELLGKGVARVLLNYGFMESPHIPTEVVKALAELGLVADAERTVYLIGKETMIVTEKGRMGRVTEPLFALLSRNIRGVTDYFAIPPEQVIELGMQIDL